MSKLLINNEESDIVRDFYDWFLESDGSIRNVTFRSNDQLNNYPTKNNSSWSSSQMVKILENLLYCAADQDAYEYFKNHAKVQIVNSKNDLKIMKMVE